MTLKFRSLLRRLFLISLIVLAVLALTPTATQAQQSSVAYGVFFYSPTCPHCEDVIENHWPGIQSQFGDRLQVLFVNVTTQDGSQVMRTAIGAMHISSSGVPMLILGSTVLTGSIDIPERAPTIIRAGLNSGGIGMPPIPGIEELFKAAGQLKSLPSHDGAQEHSAANSIAVGVAVGLALSLVVVLIAGRSARLLTLLRGNLGWGAEFCAAVVGICLAVSLVAGSTANLTIMLLAASVSVLFLVVIVFLSRSGGQSSRWLVPLIAVAGLVVAGYLSYVELTATSAVCGTFAGCETVQQSAYARILGIPIGVVGMAGYVAILLAWAAGQMKLRVPADAALLVFALIGTAFSLYLTILEPFVIGASCVWCLTSAVTMIMLLWIAAPAGWNALRSR